MILVVACVGAVLGVTPVAAVGSVNTVAFFESIIGVTDDACIVRVVVALGEVRIARVRTVQRAPCEHCVPRVHRDS